MVAARHDSTGSRSSKFKGSMFKGLKLFMGLNGCAVYRCAVYKFLGLTSLKASPFYACGVSKF